MLSVPQKVGSGAARIPVTGPLVGLFKADVIASPFKNDDCEATPEPLPPRTNGK
jgi:hypothetical protein